MAKAKRYEFKHEMIRVTTPVAKTFFMCVTEPSEYTDNFGGSLIFDDAILDTPVGYTLGKKKSADKVPFRQLIDDMIDNCLAEYKESGKKAVRADKLVAHTDAEGDVIDGVTKLSCKNNEALKVFDKYGKADKDFDETVGNGSEVKARINLVPYVMQGKVGVTVYINSIQIITLEEVGGKDDAGFDDESGDDDMPDWDNNDATNTDDNGDY